MTTLPPESNASPHERSEAETDAATPSSDQPRRRRTRRSAIAPNQESSGSPAPSASSVPPKTESPEPVEPAESLDHVDNPSDDRHEDLQTVAKNQSFVFVENTEWTLSRMGKSHKVHLIQSGQDVTGHYTQINNDSQFHGTVTRKGDTIFLISPKPAPPAPIVPPRPDN